jgi:hypothetical protein
VTSTAPRAARAIRPSAAVFAPAEPVVPVPSQSRSLVAPDCVAPAVAMAVSRRARPLPFRPVPAATTSKEVFV